MNDDFMNTGSKKSGYQWKIITSKVHGIYRLAFKKRTEKSYDNTNKINSIWQNPTPLIIKTQKTGIQTWLKNYFKKSYS